MTAHAPKRLRALGIDVTEDGGGGYELWRNKQRVGRVFSRALRFQGHLFCD